MKLYELEAALAQYNFIRVSDSKLPWLLTAHAFVLSFSCTIIITTLLEKKDDDKMNSALENFK